jgi:PAS domain-containing protein
MSTALFGSRILQASVVAFLRSVRRKDRMSSDTTVSRLAPTNGGTASGAEAAEYERQFREILEYCPAALLVVDEDGRYCFIMRACAKFSGTARANSIFAILVYIGTTSTNAHGSSNNCRNEAARF